MTTFADNFLSSFNSGLRPDFVMSVSDWADANRVLSQTALSEPGRFRTSRTPYLKDIMDALSPSSPYEKVVFMKGAQIGGTEAGNNWIGYIIDQAPGPMLVVQPTVEMGKRWSKGRLAPLIDDTSCLRNKMKDPRSRDSGNTVQSKEFPGGQVVITGTAVGLRSMPVRYLFLDEVDAPDWGFDRREKYRIGRVPNGGQILTAGVDVQNDRLELEIVAWGNESWSVDYRSGAPNDPKVWQKLSEILVESFESEDEICRKISMLAIDSGFSSQEVYAWVRSQTSFNVMAVKGIDNSVVPLNPPTKVDVNFRGKKIRNGVRLWKVGVSLLKAEKAVHDE